jgi:hypothetical protein
MEEERDVGRGAASTTSAFPYVASGNESALDLLLGMLQSMALQLPPGAPGSKMSVTEIAGGLHNAPKKTRRELECAPRHWESRE